MSKIRQRTKHLIYSGLIGAGIMGILSTGYLVHYSAQERDSKKALQQAYEQKMNDLKEKYKYQTIEGWSLSREIPAGHLITVEDLQQVELPNGRVPRDYIQSREEIVGKIAKLSLKEQTLMTQTLLFEDEQTSDDVRWREMSFIQLPASLKTIDVVDIRIQFPTGQDYILLSKKKIEQLVSGTITVKLNEAEILSLSSAIVDAYLHKASIYALTYVEPQLQSKSIPTYPANDAVLKLIKKDPNIVSKAEQALNQSARETLEKDLTGLSPQRAVEFGGSSTSSSSYEPLPTVRTEN